MNQPHDATPRILVIDSRGDLFDAISPALNDAGADGRRLGQSWTVDRINTGDQAMEHIHHARTVGAPYPCVFWNLATFNDHELAAWSADLWREDRSLSIVACIGESGIGWKRLADAFLRPDGWYVIEGRPGPVESRQLAALLIASYHAPLTSQVEALRQELAQAADVGSLVEVSNGVLHNVGNVLNSVTVSTGLLHDRLQKSKVPGLLKATELMREHAENLPDFIGSDERGRHLPGYLIHIAAMIEHEQEDLFQELSAVSRNMEHIKQIISTQQSYARLSGALEQTDLKELLEDAIRINAAGLERRGIELQRAYDPVPPCMVDRHKVLQVMVNLISNAKAALNSTPAPKRITVRLGPTPDTDSRARVQVIDNGMGISPENLDRIFEHGFTTRPDGHGFGLHSAINAAREMHGSLSAESDGPNHGATFTLDLPIAHAPEPDR